MDAKDREYVPCPKCRGEGPRDCSVCYGMKTIPKELVDFGESRGMRLVWTCSPVEEAEDLANEEARRAEAEKQIAEHRAKHPSKPHELFSVGELVRWKDGLVEKLGLGPFKIVRIELRGRERFSDNEHPQILFLEDKGGRRKARRPPRKKPRAEDFGFTPVNLKGEPIPLDDRLRVEKFFEEGGISASWFTKA